MSKSNTPSSTIKIPRDKPRVFIAEGETEIKLLSSLYEGKTRKINLWNQNILKFLANMKGSILIIVYDTDQTGNINRFKENLNFLDKNHIPYYLLQQTLNFEDEILRGTNCRSVDVFFNTNSQDEFKTKFNNCSNPLEVLSKKQINYYKLWQGEHLADLSPWKSKRISHTHLEHLMKRS